MQSLADSLSFSIQKPACEYNMYVSSEFGQVALTGEVTNAEKKINRVIRKKELLVTPGYKKHVQTIMIHVPCINSNSYMYRQMLV